jgi:alpha-amylase
MKRRLVVAVLLFFSLHVQVAVGQTVVKKVIFQAFWWDYWNNNFPANWADYLTELTPRLKSYGIDVLWLPPNSKAGGVGTMGYGASDPYDLGDKYQKYKGNTAGNPAATRFGTKNSLLRTIAVLHANGMEALQDVVLNHFDNAGADSTYVLPSNNAITITVGGIDSNTTSLLTNNGYKNFRHVSYSTPAVDQSYSDYYTRNGRWPANFPNFYPNLLNPCCTNDINSPFWGPDISYESSGYGQSSNIPVTGTAGDGINRAYYNPAQSSNYMVNNARAWLAWYKKQTGVDGLRWGAVKHFPLSVQQDLIRNIKYGIPAWAQGGNSMTNIGEWIGNAADLDQYVANVAAPSGSYGYEEHTGTFDFNLRGYGTNGGVYGMVMGNGAFNMQNLPGEQQQKRTYNYGSLKVHRTIPFINSHDTYRPILDANGNFTKPLGDATGWNTGNELGGNGQHIDPREPRLAAAYATVFSMDGNPVVFFEDLFDVGTTGKRYTHLPSNVTDLPARPDIVNIIQCHQALGFKNGDYAVPTSLSGGGKDPFYQSGNGGDHIVFERTGKALIGITDYYNAGNSNANDEKVYVTCQFPIGTVLYDYTGAHGINSVTVTDNFGDVTNHRVLIQTAPAGHTIGGACGHGYSVWAPLPAGVNSVNSTQDLYNILSSRIQNNNNATTQEWEMADDLGDSHCKSLGQGGALPANSTNQRIVGKIFVAAGKQVSHTVYPETDGNNITLSLWDNNGNTLYENSGVLSLAAPLTGNYIAPADMWLTIKVRNTTNTQPKQKLYVRLVYTAPAQIDTRVTSNAPENSAAIWTGNKNTTDISDCGNWEEGKIPSAATNVIIPANALPFPVFNTDIAVNNITIENGASLQINNSNTLIVNGNWINNNNGILNICGKVAFAGSVLQQVYGKNNFCRLEINNASSVNAQNDNSVQTQLILSTGKLMLNGFNLTMQSGSQITGGSATAYIQLYNNATGGFLIQEVGSSAINYPIGNTNYTPVSITNTGIKQNFQVRCFEDVLTNGLTGTSLSSAEKIKKTWEVTPAANGAVADLTFNWNAANHDMLFNVFNCLVAKNEGGAGAGWQQVSAQNAAAGVGPYAKTASGISTFSKFSVFSSTAILPVKLISFSGNAVNKQAVLLWHVGEEVNTINYQIERSEDGVHFTAVGVVPAAHTSTYQYKDAGFNYKNWYRLAITDANGEISYSNIVMIKADSREKYITVTPNPFNSKIKITAAGIRSNETAKLQLTNASGVIIFTTSGTVAFLENAVNSNIPLMHSGIYFLEISTTTTNQIIKLIKQ